MDTFWNQSWEKLDPERITTYIRTFQISSNPIIDYLHSQKIHTVCDAGCGCGIYTLLLAANGFQVSGFDISPKAVEIARNLLNTASYHAELKAASVLSSGYPDSTFDCVLSRDVLDHMRKSDAIAAVIELLRITKPGGLFLFTVDSVDEEYETEPHTVNLDGDYLFNSGKWDGMIFHPYSIQEIPQILPSDIPIHIHQNDDEMLVLVQKPA